MRLFVGVELDGAVRGRAASLTDDLRTRLEGAHRVRARWIDPPDLHLTLCFIGEVEDARGQAMLAALDRPFGLSPFRVRIDGFGAFPPSGAPRVLWLGVRSGGDGLAELHRQIEGRLQPLGYEPERRPYSAHLTIARVKDLPRGAHAAVRALLTDAPADAGTFTAARVTAFRSRLSPKGAAYEALLRVPLE